MITKIKAFILKLEQSIQFVAFMAHSFVFFVIVCLSGKYQLEAAIVLTAAGAIKEYYFDARDEKNPPQTFWDNTTDFIAFAIGSWIPYLFHLHIVRSLTWPSIMH